MIRSIGCMAVGRKAVSAALFAAFVVPVLPAQTDTEFLRSEVLGKLEWRNVGPVNFGGRVVDFAVDPRRSSTFYVATATGGIWKTRNNGTTFQSIFDSTPALSIGDIALAPSNPDVIYVGTGEANNQRSSYWGDGVYRSTDGGTTWQHVGLERTEHIGRIVVHPTDPDTAWVAALGALYTPNPERGLFRTKNGGRSWESVKTIDENVGFVDVAVDPKNPDVLFAASYERRRRAHDFTESGPGSAIWKSTDGGDKWQKLESGLPSGKIGRIGLAVFAGDPKIVYALVENANPRTSRARASTSEASARRDAPSPGPAAPQRRSRTQGGELYRSDDGGESWKKQNRSAVGGSPHYYYGQVRVSPTDPDRVFVLGVRVSTSTDAGKTWKTIARSLHSDHHALWIDPDDPDRLLLGNDGGPGISHDGGETWDYLNDLPLGQFYSVGVDNRDPYWIYGGLQDNGTWGTPSRAPSRRGLAKRHSVRINGGDGFYACVDPEDPNVVYSESQFGALTRTNLSTGATSGIKPRRERGQPALRFNWMSPILISPHAPRTIYFASQFVHRSRDRGDHWEVISADLTTNDAEKIKGNVPHCTITTLAESPIEEGLLLAGTDDGNVWISRNGGDRWTDLSDRFPGLPAKLWVSRVETSHRDADTFYVSFTGYREDLRDPYVFMTTDGGEKFVSIAADLPRASVNVVREHPRNADVLLVGTEEGVFVSIDAGASWHPLRGAGSTTTSRASAIAEADNTEEDEEDEDEPPAAQLAGTEPSPASTRRGGARGQQQRPTRRRSRRAPTPLPAVPVHDLVVHPRDADLIIATHGRGIYVMDITPLEDLDEQLLGKALHVFPPRDAHLTARGFSQGYEGHRGWKAANPTTGAIFRYYLRDDSDANVVVRVLDAAGGEIYKRNGPSRDAGLHEVTWNPSSRAGNRRGGFGGLFGRSGRSSRASYSGPGTYLLRITHGETVVDLPFEVHGSVELSEASAAGDDEGR